MGTKKKMIGTKFQLLRDLRGINASMGTMPPPTSPARDPCSYSDSSRTLQYYAQLKRLVFFFYILMIRNVLPSLFLLQ